MLKSEAYKLTNSDISSAIDSIKQVLEKKKVNKNEIINLVILCEESLLFYQDKLGKDASFDLLIRPFGFNDFRISIYGKRIKFDIDNGDDYCNILSSNFPLRPSWSYRKGKNNLEFPFNKPKLSQVKQLLIVFVLVAIVCSLAQIAPTQVVSDIKNSFITPTKDFILKILLGFSCPVIFFSVLMGILNISSLSNFKNSGIKILKTIFLLSVSLFLIVALSGLFLLNFEHSSDSGVSFDWVALYKLIIELFPTNPLKPFIECNSIHIIILAIIVAIVCLTLGQKVKLIKDIFSQLSLIFEKILEMILKALPVIMFFVLTDAFISPDLSLIMSSIGILLYCLYGCVMMFVLQLVIPKVFKKVPIIDYLKHAKNCLLIAFSTSSSMAAYPSSIKLCTDYLKIDKNIVTFGVALAGVLYCPIAAVLFCATGYFATIQMGTSISISWLISLLFVSWFFSFTVPPVPGGFLAATTLFVTTFNLPAEYIATVSALSIIIDFVFTLLKMQGGHTIMIMAGKKD